VIVILELRSRPSSGSGSVFRIVFIFLRNIELDESNLLPLGLSDVDGKLLILESLVLVVSENKGLDLALSTSLSIPESTTEKSSLSHSLHCCHLTLLSVLEWLEYRIIENQCHVIHDVIPEFLRSVQFLLHILKDRNVLLSYLSQFINLREPLSVTSCLHCMETEGEEGNEEKLD